MSPQRRAIVAELGRPETPEETAERKAADSQRHRARQTANNLWLSLLATMAVVLVIVLLVPRAEGPRSSPIDFARVAAEAQPGAPSRLAVPALPAGWRANAAEYRSKTVDGVTVWYIGFLTPGNEYLGLSQTENGNASWLASTLNSAPVTGTLDIGGVTWSVHDRRTGSKTGNVRYALSAQGLGAASSSTLVVYGTAGPAEASVLAAAAAAAIGSP